MYLLRFSTFVFIPLLFIFSFQSRAEAVDEWKNLDLDVQIFSGSVWTEALVAQRLVEVNRIFAQCQIAITNPTISSIQPPMGELNLYRDLEFFGSSGLKANVLALGRTSRLTLVLIRQFHEGIAGTAGIRSVYEHSLPEMVNRAWVTEEVLEPTYTLMRHPRYNTEAHELAHILLNSGHVDDGRYNLMAGDPDFVNDELDSSQCATMRASPLLRLSP